MLCCTNSPRTSRGRPRMSRPQAWWFLVSACVTFVNVPVIKEGHLGWGKSEGKGKEINRPPFTFKDHRGVISPSSSFIILSIGNFLLVHLQESHQGMRRQFRDCRRQDGTIVSNKCVIRSHLRGIKIAFF